MQTGLGGHRLLGVVMLPNIWLDSKYWEGGQNMIIEPKTLNPLEIYKLYVQLQVLFAEEG